MRVDYHLIDHYSVIQLLDEGRLDEGSDNELALITGQVRRMLSQTAVKAQVSCLLSRIYQVGPGNKQIAKKIISRH